MGQAMIVTMGTVIIATTNESPLDSRSKGPRGSFGVYFGVWIAIGDLNGHHDSIMKYENTAIEYQNRFEIGG
jgi:hypothetical protein